MHLTEPGSGLASGLTVPILRALAGRSSPATAAQVHRATGQGTEAGVRRALERLAHHGVVLSEQVGDRTVYRLNDDHLLHPVVVALLRAEDELSKRLRKELAGWDLQPVSACLYGSAARRDGDLDSDIDVLLVRPGLRDIHQRQTWAFQVTGLRDKVFRWTGNRCQVTDRPLTTLTRLARAREPIVDAWRNEAIRLAGADIKELVGSYGYDTGAAEAMHGR